MSDVTYVAQQTDSMGRWFDVGGYEDEQMAKITARQMQDMNGYPVRVERVEREIVWEQTDD